MGEGEGGGGDNALVRLSEVHSGVALLYEQRRVLGHGFVRGEREGGAVTMPWFTSVRYIAVVLCCMNSAVCWDMDLDGGGGQ